MKSTSHVTFRNQSLFCAHCGATQDIPFPVEIPVFGAMTKAFTKTHKDCELTWEEPQVDQSLPETEKAIFWLRHGEHGDSSKTLFHYLSGTTGLIGEEDAHPHDPNDFRRCWKLLNTVPEWKAKLPLMKEVSPVWSKLVEHWDELTRLLEEQILTKKDNGMYDLMKLIGC